MRDCTTCPDKDYCIPDECLGAKKKMPSRTAMRKGHIEKYPFKVYHIVKPKGNRTMIELKITVETANELNQEIKDLHQAIVGSSIDKADAIDRAKEEVKAKKAKATTKVETPVEEETPAPKEEEPETPTEETPVKEEPPKQEAPSLEATREAVKDVMAKATDKTKAKGEFKAFLDSIGAEKVTSATDEQRIQIMEWVNSRG